jgi:hypothetical protein
MGGSRERIVILKGQQHNGWKGFRRELWILLNLEPRTNKHQLQGGAGRVGGMEMGKHPRRDEGPLKSYREAVSGGQREAAKSENMRKCETKYRETEKVKDSTKAVLVNAIPEVEGKVDSNLGATVTTKSMERIMPRQFFPEAAPVIPRNLGKGITIHINESGQRQVTWTAKGNPKLGKQWVPRDRHEDTTNTQQVGPVFINGPSESRVTKGFGPRSTYEAGESSGSKKQQNGPNDEIRDSMGSEGSRNRNGSNLVDNGPSTLAYSSHGLPNLHLKESRAFLTGRGAYQIRVDWHLVEALIYTNRGMISEVPVK